MIAAAGKKIDKKITTDWEGSTPRGASCPVPGLLAWHVQHRAALLAGGSIERCLLGLQVGVAKGTPGYSNLNWANRYLAHNDVSAQ